MSAGEETTPPILADKHHDAPSAFTPQSLLREARRQKGAEAVAVPKVCLLDPDGDIVRQLRVDLRGVPADLRLEGPAAGAGKKRLRALAEWSFGGGERYCEACQTTCPDCPARLNRPDPRYAPDPAAAPGLSEGPRFLPVEIVETVKPPSAAPVAQNLIEIELAGGHRMRISGGYGPEALARLIRGLTA